MCNNVIGNNERIQVHKTFDHLKYYFLKAMDVCIFSFVTATILLIFKNHSVVVFTEMAIRSLRQNRKSSQKGQENTFLTRGLAAGFRHGPIKAWL